MSWLNTREIKWLPRGHGHPLRNLNGVSPYSWHSGSCSHEGDIPDRSSELFSPVKRMFFLPEDLPCHRLLKFFTAFKVQVKYNLLWRFSWLPGQKEVFFTYTGWLYLALGPACSQLGSSDASCTRGSTQYHALGTEEAKERPRAPLSAGFLAPHSWPKISLLYNRFSTRAQRM